MATEPVHRGIKRAYLLDNAWQHERQRLALLEGRLDPGSIHHLQDLGVGPGWRCLTVGSGGGSITEWLCQRVGPSGQVVATDINTRFLEALDYPNLEVRQHDILADELEQEAFDLVHVRALLMNIAEPQRALQRLVSALKSGGWLLAEEGDIGSMVPQGAPNMPESRLFLQFREACVAALDSVGGDYHYGRRLYWEICDQGLAGVQAEGRLHLAQGRSPLARFWRLNLDQMHDALVRYGNLSEEQLENTRLLFDNADFAFTTTTVWAVWGQRP
jgi:SAM-dependent methyltransferase